MIKNKSHLINLKKLYAYIRTSNFGVEAERSHFFLQFEPENVLSMFLKLCSIVFQLINADVTRN